MSLSLKMAASIAFNYLQYKYLLIFTTRCASRMRSRTEVGVLDKGFRFRFCCFLVVVPFKKEYHPYGQAYGVGSLFHKHHS